MENKKNKKSNEENNQNKKYKEEVIELSEKIIRAENEAIKNKRIILV